MPKIKTAKALIKALHNVAEDAPSALSVRLNGTTHALSPNGFYVGTIAGEDYAALILGDATFFLEVDRSATAKTVKLIQEPTTEQIDAIARQLLPEPEPPAEVKAAIEAITAIKLPRGWKWGTDAKGNPQPVEDDGSGETATGAPRQRARRGTAIKKEKKPEVVKGTILTRSKDGYQYRVSGVDANLKKMFFEPVVKGEGDEGLAATYPAPVFWKNWKEVVS